MNRSLVFASLLGALTFSCGQGAPVGPGHETSRQEISGGTPDAEHTYVLGLFAQKGWSGGMCTGSLIAPNLVLTARHCVSQILSESENVICGESPFSNPYSGQNIYVSSDPQLSQHSDNWFQGAKIIVPDEGNDTCGYDVALVILNQSLPIQPTVPRIDQEVVVGEPYTAVGYGTTGSAYSSGNRMQRTGLTVQCTPGSCPSWSSVQSTEWGGETGICQGDSGGPALDADKKVIGVVSRGLPGCDAPTYGSVWVWKDMIMAAALEAAQVGGYAPPNWAVTGSTTEPEPPVGGEPPTTGGEPPTGTPDAQGTPCSTSVACPAGYGCFTSTGSESDAVCSAECSTDAECGAGLSCNGAGVCSAPVNSAEDADSSGGCTLSRTEGSGPTRPVPWLIGLGLALGLVLRRRR